MNFKTIIGAAISGGDLLIPSNIGDSLPSTSIVYQKEQGSKLMNALVKKEVTEEVKQLRFRTYLIERESNKYGVKIEHDEAKTVHFADFTKPNVFEEENKKILLIQNTEPITSGVENNVDVSREGINFKQYYPLEFERNETFPKFRFEKFCKQIVLKENENDYQLDLYFNSIPSTDDRIERNLTFDLEKVFNKTLKIDYLDSFETIEIVTNNSWGNVSNIRYKFKPYKFVCITKFSTFFIVSYSVIITEQEDMIEQYYNETISKEYENNTKRPNTNIPIDIFTGVPQGTFDVEICDKCGKEMEGLERADYRITKSYTGIGYCKECYQKHLDSYKKSHEIYNEDDYKPIPFRGTIE
jgi:hypothetical protein